MYGKTGNFDHYTSCIHISIKPANCHVRTLKAGCINAGLELTSRLTWEFRKLTFLALLLMEFPF
jgi:hypothetical protein